MWLDEFKFPYLFHFFPPPSVFLTIDRRPLEAAQKSLTSGTAVIRGTWPDSHDSHRGDRQQLSPVLAAAVHMCVSVSFISESDCGYRLYVCV